MHIPENYLSPQTCGVMTAAMVPVWGYAVRKVKIEISREKMPLLGVGAAFSFLGMMFNVPIPGGTTGHAVGGTLIALMLGPNAACIAVTIALLIQALLFGDGGILAFGANCFNMAFVLPYVGYGVSQLIRRMVPSERGRYLGAAIGAYAGINAAALCAAIEFGIQPALFHDAAGQALYCPYGLSVSIPAMMIGHLTIFGLAELIYTTAIYAFINRTAPGMLQENTHSVSTPAYLLIGALILAVPLGLLAEGTAWGEWGVDEIAEVVSGGTALGYTPAGMANGFELSSIFPDYTINGLPDTAAYILSAVIGVALCVILFRVIAASMKRKVDFAK
jgi:cobalt/nickel transport system permease protein